MAALPPGEAAIQLFEAEDWGGSLRVLLILVRQQDNHVPKGAKRQSCADIGLEATQNNINITSTAEYIRPPGREGWVKRRSHHFFKAVDICTRIDYSTSFHAILIQILGINNCDVGICLQLICVDQIQIGVSHLRNSSSKPGRTQSQDEQMLRMLLST
ncbi:hypothetical protein BC829DRAFT_423336 [Chytridium lagenaria]|nr:hypothetical protein BC829DRAFT_423336 [Chytridium lagenaria]